MTEQQFGSLKEGTIVYNTKTNLVYSMASWFDPEKTEFKGSECLSLSPRSINAVDSYLPYKELADWELFDITAAIPMEVRLAYLEYETYELQRFVHSRLL